MEEVNDRAHGSDGSDPESDISTILQYLIRSEQVHQIISPDRDDSEEEFVTCENVWQPNIETLKKSEISALTKLSAGLSSRTGEERPNSIAAMICARERGMVGSTTFSKADCCKISNNFLPNKSSVMAHIPTKIFCGIYLDDGKIFLSASQDRLIRLFDTSKGKFSLVKTITAKDVGWSILDVAISPDGNYLAYSIRLCKIWGNTDMQESLLLCPEERKFCIFSLKFSSSGKEILCGANDGYIYVYDRECNQRAFSIVGHDDDVNAVAFADDRSHILYSGGDDGICKVWDRRVLAESHPKPVGYLAGHMLGITYIEPRGDGRHLLTNSKDQSIKLWDVRKFSSDTGIVNTLRTVSVQNWDYRWKKVPKSLNNPNKRLEGDTSIMTYRGHSVLQTLCRCHFTPMETTGQRYIYTGCAGGRIIIYDVLTGKIEKELFGHRAPVRDASWHPHKPELTSVSWDGKIIRWTYQEKQWLDSDDEENLDILAAGKRKRKEMPNRRSQRLADRRAKLGECVT
ncbi:hypothetical protein RUM43_002487 [Polyplax serrata]|uniref:Uncharacterized protein n=1 Tax=Polyplax serrata TaxID=468196 RepID=A0AAN8S4S7_POLSC